MTDMPLTHCHTCGRELPWNRIYLGDRAYCGAECLPVKTVGASTGPQTCHACGKELPVTGNWWLGGEQFCSSKCMDLAETMAVQGRQLLAKEEQKKLAALEADLAEALELLEQYAKDASGFASGQAWLYLDRQRVAVRVLAKHGRFKITKDDDWTEGFWPEK